MNDTTKKYVAVAAALGIAAGMYFSRSGTEGFMRQNQPDEYSHHNPVDALHERLDVLEEWFTDYINTDARHTMASQRRIPVGKPFHNPPRQHDVLGPDGNPYGVHPERVVAPTLLQQQQDQKQQIETIGMQFSTQTPDQVARSLGAKPTRGPTPNNNVPDNHTVPLFDATAAKNGNVSSAEIAELVARRNKRNGGNPVIRPPLVHERKSATFMGEQ